MKPLPSLFAPSILQGSGSFDAPSSDMKSKKAFAMLLVRAATNACFFWARGSMSRSNEGGSLFGKSARMIVVDGENEGIGETKGCCGRIVVGGRVARRQLT